MLFGATLLCGFILTGVSLSGSAVPVSWSTSLLWRLMSSAFRMTDEACRPTNSWSGPCGVPLPSGSLSSPIARSTNCFAAGAYCRTHGHRGICSESEWRQVERDIALAEKTDCQYHVCHVSTAESVELVRRAKARGVRVSCETAPHYLLLCDEDLQEDGRFKMNPPLRSRTDRDALREGLCDGTIEVIATDHAPHTAEEKSRGLAGSAMGIVGLECAFPVLYTGLVVPGLLPLERLITAMTDNPRRIFWLEGGLHVGDAADFTVLDLDDEYVIDPVTFRSKGRATPFAGWRVQGRAVRTVVGGCTVYDATTGIG